MSQKVMRLIDPRSGLMECKVCGARHAANLVKDSSGRTRYGRGAWQCKRGCRIEKGKAER